MTYIKKFENFKNSNQGFDNDNGKIWITGIPSGESFNLDIDTFDDIYATGILKYNTEYVSTGFFTFEDSDSEKIKRMMAWSKEYFSNSNRKYDIEKHNFKDFDKILDSIKDIESDIDIIARGNVIMFVSGNCKIYLLITDLGTYELKIVEDGEIIDDYMVPVASAAPNRIKEEAMKYFDGIGNSNQFKYIPKDEDLTFRLAREKTGGHLFIIEKVVNNNVIVFNGFQHFNKLKEFDLYPQIEEFDEVYIYDRYQKYPGGRFVNTQREWKTYRYKELPRVIKDMLIK